MDGRFDKQVIRDSNETVTDVRETDASVLRWVKSVEIVEGLREISIDINNDGLFDQKYIHNIADSITPMYLDADQDGAYEQYYEVYISGQSTRLFTDTNGDGNYDAFSVLG